MTANELLMRCLISNDLQGVIGALELGADPARATLVHKDKPLDAWMWLSSILFNDQQFKSEWPTAFAMLSAVSCAGLDMSRPMEPEHLSHLTRTQWLITQHPDRAQSLLADEETWRLQSETGAARGTRSVNRL